MKQELINEIKSGRFGEAKEKELLKDYTTLKIGGPADILVKPSTESQIIDLLKYCSLNNINITTIGNGSNLLIRDKGVRGLVISLRENFSDILVEKENITAQSGALLKNVALKSFEQGLTGMEAVSGIPGSVGGAMVMNAGAYGIEMKDIVKSVRCATLSGEIIDFSNKDMDFRYRHSKASDEKLIVLSATFSLKEGDKEAIYEAFEDFDYKRSSKQPLDKNSAGSTFKRPEGYFASKLIDEAGLRGFRVGDAQVSEKHCGFLINIENSTCENFLNLISQVKKIVKEKYGVELEREVKLIGEE